MPRTKDNRTHTILRIPVDWLVALTNAAADLDMPRATFIRLLISEGFKRRNIEHSPDDYGVFESVCRRKSDRLRQKRTGYMRTYRARRRAKELAGASNAPILWTFHPSGQITTSDLDVLATSVGLIDSSGHFLPESTRYSKDRVLSELRELAELGPLPDPRYDEFLRLNPL